MIVALHGFLGQPSDWDFLRNAGFDVVTPPLDRIPRSGDVLLGYSLGGRLALHALLAGASYRRVVVISAGLGVEDEDARSARSAADAAWARRFESEEWPSLMRAWGSQELFGGHVMPRREENFDRAKLARQLRHWSPAALPPVASRLHEISSPVLWMAGGRDLKYVAEAQRAVALLPHAELWICPGAAHRVPWEQPGPFIDRLRLALAPAGR